MLGWGLFGLGVFGLVTSTIFLGLVIAGSVRFRSNAERQEALSRVDPPFLPAISVFKPLHGAEAELEANLRSLYEQDYLGYSMVNGMPLEVAGVSRLEVLFCARYEDDAGLVLARKVAADFPQVTTRFCESGEPWAANAKVCSLATMARFASHDLWVISDSDVRVGPDYLRRIVIPFVDSAVGCATCLYRGVVVKHGIWSWLEAVGMTVEMSSGVVVSNLLEPMCFALGPTMLARRECVDEVGGFAAMAEYCADDFVLGNWIEQKGHRVVLSSYAIDHMVLQAGFVESIMHQVRWMKSTRFSRPKGHFGTALTFAVPFGLMAWAGAILLGMPVVAWAALLASLLGRSLQAWIVAKFVVHERRIWPTVLLFPLRDAMGMLAWVLSYVGDSILWRGETYRLVKGGLMLNARLVHRR